MSNTEIIEAAPKVVSLILQQPLEKLNSIIMNDTNKIYYKVITDPENTSVKTPYFQVPENVKPSMTIMYDDKDNIEIYYSKLQVRLRDGPQWLMFNVTDLEKIINKMTNQSKVTNAMNIVKDIANGKAELMKARNEVKAEAKAVAREAAREAVIEALEKEARRKEIEAEKKTEIEIIEERDKLGIDWKDVRERKDAFTDDDLPEEFKLRKAHERAARAEALQAAISKATQEIDELLGGKRKSVRRGKLNHRRKSVRRRKLKSRR